MELLLVLFLIALKAVAIEMVVLQFLLCGLVLTLTIGYLYYIFKQRRVYELAAKITGDNGLPLLGSLLEFLKTPFSEYLNMFAKLNNRDVGIWRIWIGPKLTLYINSPECLQVVLNSPHCLKKPGFFYDTFDYVKHGLVLANGDEWKHHRKVISSSFNLNVLQELLPIFDEKTKISLKVLEKHVNGKEFNMYDHSAACTLESLMRGLMRYDRDCQTNPHDHYILKSVDV
jgi:cytochrome P450